MLRRISTLIAIASLLTLSSPAIGQSRADKQERAEKGRQQPRSETPYSNRAQQRERALREAAREIEKDRSEGFHRFGRPK